MGALTTVGILSNGSISAATRASFRDNTVNIVEQGVSIGSTSVTGGQIDVGDFKTLSMDQHYEKYPAWNVVYVSGILQNVAATLDLIPDAGILRPIGIFDPTKPIALVIVKLQTIFDRILGFLGIPSLELLLLNIDVIISKSTKILDSLQKVIQKIPDGIEAAKNAADDFFDVIKEIIREIIPSDAIDNVIRQINEISDQIKEKIVETAIEIIASAGLSLPSLPIPALDLSFLAGLDITPLFATIERDQYDGIATKFIKMMTVFLSLPGKIAEQVVNGVQAASRIVDALKTLLINVAQGITDLVNALIGIVWDAITSVISILNVAILETASIIQSVVYFVKYLAVTLISFFMGSGLIALSAARLIGAI